jgi:uncharacterized membrane protein HdeD (DUF308 family)
MSAFANLLLTVVLLVAVFGIVWLLALVLPNQGRRAGRIDWGKLIAGVLATALGIRTVITGHIGHWLYSPQMSAAGAQARAVGALIFAMGLVIVWSWLRARQKAGDTGEKPSDDAT